MQKVLSGMAPRQMSMFGKADLAQFFTRRLHQGRDPSKWCIKLGAHTAPPPSLVLTAAL